MVDRLQGVDLHLEELAKLGLDLFLFLAIFQYIVKSFHGDSPFKADYAFRALIGQTMTPSLRR